MESFYATLPLDFGHLGDLRRALTAWLSDAGVPDARRAGAVLATHEAAANAIEHADSDGPIEVRAQLCDGTLTIEVSDSGRWKAPTHLPADDERGMGLSVIEGLVSELEIRTDSHGTTLRMSQQA